MEATQALTGATAGSGGVRRIDEACLVGSDRVRAVLEELARHADGVALDEPTVEELHADGPVTTLPADARCRP